ncbi:MAG: hypothetical protein ACLFVQ_05555, partial [Chitinispirillaceae bacterium]
KILSRTTGYVRSYKVTSTSRELGLVRVTVEAEVEDGKLQDDLIAQQLLYEIKNRPRIMVLLDERVSGEEMFEKTATHVLEEQLLKRGFKIVEQEQLEKLQSIEETKSMGDSDLASLGFRTGADLIIRGRISVGKPSPKTVYGTQFYTVPVQLNARIVRADNAQILVTKTRRTKKNSREEFSATQFGLETGAKALAKELIDELNEFWKSEAYNHNNVELVISGLESEELKRTETSLQTHDFVRNMNMRYLEEATALYDVSLSGTVQDLRAVFDKDKNQGLSVLALSANRIKVGRVSSNEPVKYEEELPNIEITRFEISDIFPSRARYYESSSLGKLNVRCNNRSVKNLHISIHIPELMQLPVESRINEIGPGAQKSMDLQLLLVQDKLFEIAENKTINGQVKVSYLENGRKITRSLTAPANVHSRNAMDWSLPDALGGFVTYNADPVRSLARSALRAAGTVDSDMGDLLNAAALFEALSEMGIMYVKDPAPSGSVMLDMVQYPAETMKLRSGDCDDLSVLYAALLSSVGIQTAFISYHDHVLVMFNTGIYRKNRMAISADTSLSVVHNGMVWIPVEATAIGKGFCKAWQLAASEFHQAIREGQRVSIIDLSKAWKVYPPVSYSRDVGDIVLDGIDSALEKQVQLIKKTKAESIQKAVAELQKQDKSAKTYNRIGILMAQNGEYQKATDYFKNAMKENKAPQIAANYASAVLISGKEKEAQKLFDEIYSKDRTGRIAVNRALSYYVSATDASGVEQFVAALQHAVRMMPESASLSGYLGVDLDDSDGTKAAGEHETQKARNVNVRRLKELIRQRVLASAKKKAERKGRHTVKVSDEPAKDNPPAVMPFGGIRGADPEQVEKIRNLLYWFE